MFSVLYIDIIKESARSDSFLLTYYVLNYSGNYINLRDEEKVYKEIRVSSTEELSRELGTALNLVDSDDEDLYVYTSLDETTLSGYLSSASEFLYVERVFDCKRIQTALSYPDTWSVFDIYASICGVSRKDTTYVEMLDAIISFLVKDKLMQYYNLDRSIAIVSCVRVTDELYRVGYSWGTINTKSVYTALGAVDELIDIASNNRVTLFNTLRLKFQRGLAESGISWHSVVWVSIDKTAWGIFKRVAKLCCCSAFVGVSFVSLTDILREAKFLNFMEIANVLSAYFTRSEWRNSAQELGDVIASISVPAKFELKTEERKDAAIADWTLKKGVLVADMANYRRDFSSDVCEIKPNPRDRYFIALDCEGTVQRGATEVGGVIVAVKRDGRLCKLGTFAFTRLDFESDFEAMLAQWTRLTGRKETQGIQIQTYGANDREMFLKLVGSELGRKIKRKYMKYLDFRDCQPRIFEVLDRLNVSGGRKLSEVAESLGVAVIHPRHTALNDAKTLFNVLSVVSVAKLK